MNNFFDGLYTLQEIAIHYNFTDSQLSNLSRLCKKNDINTIISNFPMLKKFIPYCEKYKIGNNTVYAMPAYIYDVYTNTGLLPDLKLYDKESNINKKEFWQYNAPISFDIKPKENWEFAKNFLSNTSNLEDEDIWKIFLSGCARMNYYQNENTTTEQRIKYAILEYMLKRPQFYTVDDFVDNPILHKKYEK